MSPCPLPIGLSEAACWHTRERKNLYNCISEYTANAPGKRLLPAITLILSLLDYYGVSVSVVQSTGSIRLEFSSSSFGV